MPLGAPAVVYEVLFGAALDEEERLQLFLPQIVGAHELVELLVRAGVLCGAVHDGQMQAGMAGLSEQRPDLRVDLLEEFGQFADVIRVIGTPVALERVANEI